LLPAWATVAIALGASAITAIATLIASFRTTSLRARYEREEQWRERLVHAADDFSTSVEAALFVLNDDIEYLEMSWQRTDGVSFQNLQRSVGDAVGRVARIKLLFGANSKPGSTAVELVMQLRTTLANLETKDPRPGEDTDVEAARKALDEAYRLHDEFNRLALEAIRQRIGRRPDK
jgi:hypothetical protein